MSIGPTEGEFALAMSFDRELAGTIADAQTIINRKNARLVALAAEVTRLRAALQVETGKRRHAELQLAQATRRH